MSQIPAVRIGPQTKLIISTSGRPTSVLRYKILLEELLNEDIAYIPINSGDPANPHISPVRFAWALKGMPCIGGAISKDIKHSVIAELDEIDDEVKEIQSVNTVLVRNGRLYGYNTDVIGFRQAILAGTANLPPIRSAVCYGYGGVVSVVVAVLKKLGIERIYISGRRLDEAYRRATELGVLVWSNDVDSIDLFVNAAPVTDTPLDGIPNFLDSIRTCRVAFDHEMPGKYLKSYCSERDIHHISGYDMYYPQMVAQWKLFLEHLHLDEGKIRELLERADELAKARSS